MESFLVALAVIYLLIGLVVYVMVDLNSLLDKVDWFMVAIPEDGTYRKYMFLFVVLFWPLALFLMMMSSKK